MYILIFALILFALPARADQRIIVEQNTDRIIDFGDVNLRYDAKNFDMIDVPDNSIPADSDIREYRYNRSTATIEKRPTSELAAKFEDKWKEDIINRVKKQFFTPALEAILVEMIRRL